MSFVSFLSYTANNAMTNEQLNAKKDNILAEIGESALAIKTTVEWNSRMRSAAGRAHLRECRVELNPRLIEHGEDEVMRTLRHELAHLLAWKRAHCRTHGEPWRRACADLGIPGESVTHQLPLPRNTQAKKWRYTCHSCNVSFDRVRRAKRLMACAACCRQWNRNRYTDRFLLIEHALIPMQE